METILLVVHLLIAIFLVGFILIQRSSGGALEGLGGGSSSSSFLSARGTGNFLTKATAILATLFFITSISLSIYHRGEERRATSLLDVPVQTQGPALPQAPVAPVSGE